MVRTARHEEIVKARRKAWYRSVAMLGLTEDEQRVIVAAHLPDHDRVIPTADGEISRNSIFESAEGFKSAMARLNEMVGSRVKSHRAIDGKKGWNNPASDDQMRYMKDLARIIGWNERSEDDMKGRLESFAARQCGQGGGVRMLHTLNRRDARKVIDGLKRMVERNYRGMPNDR